MFKMLNTKRAKMAQEVLGQFCLSAGPTRGLGGLFGHLTDDVATLLHSKIDVETT